MKQPLGSALRNAGHLLMSDVDKQGAHAVEKEASKLVDGGVEVLEKLHLKVRQRTETWKAMLSRAWSSVHDFRFVFARVWFWIQLQVYDESYVWGCL